MSVVNSTITRCPGSKKMRTLTVALLSVLSLLATPTFAAPADSAAAAAPANEAPPLAMLPRWAVPRSYRLALRGDPAGAGYQGVVVIAVDLKKAADHLWLHGKDLHVARVTVTDAHRQAHAGSYREEVPAAGVARIDFGGVLEPQPLTLTITFSAPFNATLQGYYKVVFAGRAYAMTQMEPISARFAFPCFDEPGFKVPLTLSLTIPDADSAVANTTLAGEKKAGNGWKTLTFAPTKPLPTYLYAWAVGPWDIVQGPTIPPTRWRSEPVSVRGIATQGNGAKMRRALAMVPGIIEAEEKYYGFGYPFGKIDLAALPDFSAGAMENAGLVTYRDWLLLLDESSTPEAVRSTFNVEAHELAHQWTGDTVTLHWWNDIWLNEAFATWMQQKVAGQLHPDYRTDLDRITAGQRAMANDSLISARMIRQPITGNGDIDTAFDGITYLKGAMVIGMFEHFVGPQVYQRGMQAYVRAHAFANAEAQDLVGAIATAAHRDQRFKHAFSSFLDQNGVPLVATRLDCSQTGGPVLELTQSRYLPLGSMGDPGRLWGIPVCVRFPGGTQCQLVDKRTARMKIAGACPRWYMPNAAGAGYYRFDMAKPDRAALSQVISSRSDAEQLAYADSVDAAFQRGTLDAQDVLAMMQEIAPSKVREVSLAPLHAVEWIYRYGARSGTQREAVRRAVTRAYLPRLEALGYQRRAGESPDDALLRTALAESLGTTFNVPAVRTALLQQGDAALASGPNGRVDLDAANPDLLPLVLSVAVEERGAPAVSALIRQVGVTTDPVKRNAMLTALSHAAGAEADVARDFALSDQVKVGEMAMVLRGGRETRAQRDQLWRWFTAHYPRIVARTGVFSGGNLPALAGAEGCSRTEADRLTAFFTPRIDQLPGTARGLAQTRESIMLCAALQTSRNSSAIAD
ncbi:MAG TPA: M1 family metallopeptidase [Steroidobacteraceae bacterium]|nr:M1 family metallopeptidase [Steroidobacteraceae bacterium]